MVSSTEQINKRKAFAMYVLLVTNSRVREKSGQEIGTENGDRGI